MSLVSAPSRPAATPSVQVGGQEPRTPRIAWSPRGPLEYPEWLAAGNQLGKIGRATGWWIGDWLRYGAQRWGEKYRDAARITGYDTATLRNLAWVASEFPLSRRRDKLTWSHHAAVASLPPADQDFWLDTALLEKMSVSDLRGEVRAARRRETRAECEAMVADPQPAAAAAVCPTCGQVIAAT
jgi:hypothetical protein